MTDKQMICKNCRFFSHVVNVNFGLCQFNAPQVGNHHNGRSTAAWPEVHKNSFCGQFQRSPLNENEVGESE